MNPILPRALGAVSSQSGAPPADGEPVEALPFALVMGQLLAPPPIARPDPPDPVLPSAADESVLPSVPEEGEAESPAGAAGGGAADAAPAGPPATTAADPGVAAAVSAVTTPPMPRPVVSGPLTVDRRALDGVGARDVRTGGSGAARVGVVRITPVFTAVLSPDYGNNDAPSPQASPAAVGATLRAPVPEVPAATVAEPGGRKVQETREPREDEARPAAVHGESGAEEPEAAEPDRQGNLPVGVPGLPEFRVRQVEATARPQPVPEPARGMEHPDIAAPDGAAPAAARPSARDAVLPPGFLPLRVPGVRAADGPEGEIAFSPREPAAAHRNAGSEATPVAAGSFPGKHPAEAAVLPTLESMARTPVQEGHRSEPVPQRGDPVPVRLPSPAAGDARSRGGTDQPLPMAEPVPVRAVMPERKRGAGDEGIDAAVRAERPPAGADTARHGAAPPPATDVAPAPSPEAAPPTVPAHLPDTGRTAGTGMHAPARSVETSPGVSDPTPSPAMPLVRSDRVTVDLVDDRGNPGRLHVAVRGDRVRATITASDPAVAARLSGALPELERRLTEQGFRAADLTVREGTTAFDGGAVSPPGPSSGSHRHGEPSGGPGGERAAGRDRSPQDPGRSPHQEPRHGRHERRHAHREYPSSDSFTGDAP